MLYARRPQISTREGTQREMSIGGSRPFRVFARVLAMAALLWCSFPCLAAAYPNWDPAPAPLVASSCDQCHSATSSGGTSEWDGSGPHGGYIASSSKCQLCHTVHNAPQDSVLLLRGATATGMCRTCHDGTGSSIGVYATIEAHGGVVAQEHSMETTSVVPGGSSGLDGVLSCIHCHSVHAANTVEPFLRDSASAFDPAEPVISDCLLRSNPIGSAPGSYPEYGARWCASCHDQRHSDSVMTMNHPVESSLTWGYGDVTSTVLPTSYSYDYFYDPVAVGMGRTNGAYLMAPVDASGDGRVESRRDPMCQQCHEDARIVTQAFQGDYTHRGDPTDPYFNPYLDPAPINPEFLTFPHQTTNDNFLVETGDDLCMNCHSVAVLP